MALNKSTFKVADVSTPEIEGKKKCDELDSNNKFVDQFMIPSIVVLRRHAMMMIMTKFICLVTGSYKEMIHSQLHLGKCNTLKNFD